MKKLKQILNEQSGPGGPKPMTTQQVRKPAESPDYIPPYQAAFKTPFSDIKEISYSQFAGMLKTGIRFHGFHDASTDGAGPNTIIELRSGKNAQPIGLYVIPSQPGWLKRHKAIMDKGKK